MHYIPPLLETTFSKRYKIYPHYHQSLCPHLSPHNCTSLILSGSFNLSSEHEHSVSTTEPKISSNIFSYNAQLSDETVHQWIKDPIAIIDESAKSLNELLVRIAVLNCADEAPSPSFYLIFWSAGSGRTALWEPHVYCGRTSRR